MTAKEGASASRRQFLRRTGSAALGLALGAPATAARADAGLKIGIIGSGRIGSTLGALWLKTGHEIMFSSLNLENDKALASRLGGKARAGTPKEAAAFGEVLLIAVPYAALPQVGRDLAGSIRGKVVLDASNPIPARDGDIAAWARDKGAGLASAELLPGARLVRAFNAIGYSRLPEIGERERGRVGMPMAGDDPGAMAIAFRLVRDIGFEPVAVGPLRMGRYLIPGTPLAGEHAPEEIRQIVPTLK